MNTQLGFRIIVIDDNVDIHNDFIKILTSNNHEIEAQNKVNILKNQLFAEEVEDISLPDFQIDTASQGKEGFERIVEAFNQGNPYALAFVDIRMPPGWDGIETIKKIWSVDKDIQIVICTAYSDYSWEKTVANLGKSDNLLILKKPFDRIAVRQLACALTRKWKLMQEQRNYRQTLEDKVIERTQSLENSLSVTRATLESSADGIIVVDLNERIIDFNAKFAVMWNLENEIKNSNCHELFISLDQQITHPKKFFENIFMSSDILEKIILENLSLTHNRIVECYSQPHRLNEKVIGRIWSFRDITKRIILEEKLQFQATHDSLTGLPNRILMEERIAQAISDSKLLKSQFAILFFDLDRFKLINDSLSHSAGDDLLQQVIKRVEKSTRSEDTLARLGGDEFVLIMNNLKDLHTISEFASNLIHEMHDSFLINGQLISITVSAGISVYPRDGSTSSELLKNADLAMYHAKESGRDQFKFYDIKLNEEIMKNFQLELDLRHAIKNKEFELFYQPQFELTGNKLVAVEALIRWNHPTKGLILPIEFISFAESIGLINPIGEWVLHNACKQIKKWHKFGYPELRVAVNITSHELRQYDIVEKIQAILVQENLSPHYLELELTESSIINNPNIINALNTLKKLGVHIALDDFGSGYSTLNYLRTLSLDHLKIDRSFVQNILINRGDEAIIQAIIDMAKGFNLEVLAEGVETQQQLQFLKDRKCGEIQGYYFSKPLPVKELEELFENKADIYDILIDQNNNIK